MVDLNFSQGHALRVSAGQGSATVGLTPGAGVHRLAVTVTITSVGLADELPIQLGGELYAELPNARPWLGPLHVKPAVTRGFEYPEQLTCSLSDSQLWALEALRIGLAAGTGRQTTTSGPDDGSAATSTARNPNQGHSWSNAGCT